MSQQFPFVESSDPSCDGPTFQGSITSELSEPSGSFSHVSVLQPGQSCEGPILQGEVFFELPVLSSSNLLKVVQHPCSSTEPAGTSYISPGETLIQTQISQENAMDTESSPVCVVQDMSVQSAVQSSLPCMVTASQSEVDGHLLGGNSGARGLQPAPTVLPTEKPDSESCAVHNIQTDSTSAFQQFPGTSMGAVGPAGSLQGEMRDVSPSQEHSPSAFFSSDISNLKILDISPQTLTLNNSNSKIDKISLFAPNSLIFPPLSGCPSSKDSASSNELLYSKKFISHNSSTLKKNEVNREVLFQADSQENVPCKFQTKQSLSVDNNKRAASYSRALAPPNVCPSNTGSAPECGVVVEHILGLSLDMYAWATVKVIGDSAITFIGRSPGNDNNILIFVKTPVMAQKLVDEGIWIRGKWFKISFFQQPATKLTISGVLPFVPDSLIIDAFAPFGTSVYPILRKIPAAVRHQQFKGAFSYRREIYIIKSAQDIVLPDVLNISFLGMSFTLEVSSTGPKCFNCGSLLHTIGKCNMVVQSKQNNNSDSKSNSESSTKFSMTQNINLDDMHSVLPVSGDSSVAAKADSRRQNVAVIHDSSVSDDLPVLSKRDYYTQCNLLTSPSAPAVSMSAKDYSVLSAKRNKKKKDSNIKQVIMPTSYESSLVRSSRPVYKHSSTENLSVIGPLPDESFDQHNINFHVGAASIPLFDFSEPFVHSDSKRHRKSINLPIQDVGSLLPSSVVLVDTQEECSDDEHGMEVLSEDNDSQDTSTISSICNNNIVKSSPGGSIKKKNKRNKQNEQTYKNTSSVGVERRKLQVTSVSPESRLSTDPDFAFSVVNDWLNRSASLKINPRRKFTARMFEDFPDLETIIATVLSSSPNHFSPSSAKARRIKDLQDDIRAIKSEPRPIRVKKRKQN